jgi:uncharacterized protein YciI
MPEVQPCFVVEARLVAGAAERRAPYRAEHLERVGRLVEEEVVAFAGAFEDLSASLLVLTVSSEEAARAVVETDVYWRRGVWTGYTVRKLNRVVFGA